MTCHLCRNENNTTICTACERPACGDHIGQDGVCEDCWHDFCAYHDAQEHRFADEIDACEIGVKIR